MNAVRRYAHRGLAVGLATLLLFCGTKAAVSQNAAQLEQELEKARADATRLLVSLQQAEKQIAGLQAQLVASQELTKAMRAELEALRKHMADSAKQRDREFADRVSQIDQLQTEISRLRLELEQAKAERLGPPPRVPPREGIETPDPPKVEGIVLAVVDGVIEISIGSDDGLKPGHRLEAVRTTDGQGIYVGRLEVLKVTPDRAVCKSLPENEKRKIAKGDRVYSRL